MPWSYKAGANTKTVMFELKFCVKPIRQRSHELKAQPSICRRIETLGEADAVVASGDNIAKFALALGAAGNVRTRTARAWSEAEFVKLVSELP